MGSRYGGRLWLTFRARDLLGISLVVLGLVLEGYSVFPSSSLIDHLLALTVWQSSHVISGSLALLARGRRLPHVVQKRRPLKAMLG
jgi:hypothetical protein